MKFSLKKLIFCAYAAVVAVACTEKDSDAIKGITLSHSEITLVIGATEQLAAHSDPGNAIIEDVVWESSNKLVATVEKGLVKAVNVGEATITATSGKLSASCVVKVNNPEATSIEMTQKEIFLIINESFDMNIVALPEGAVQPDVVWESADKGIATVDKDGTIKGIAPGITTITAKTDKQLSAQCKVIVSNTVNVGDYYYSDGTVSSTYDAAKTVAGVVYYVGDPTSEDKMLKADHPGCKHGLVVALKQDYKGIPWQKGYIHYRNTIQKWADSNVFGYMPITTGRNFDMLDNICGYNNTKLLEAFNNADENKAWPLEVIQNVVAYRKEHPAPASSSDWYLPSCKELVLLIGGSDYTGMVVNLDNYAGHKKVINEKLKAVTNSDPIGKLNWKEAEWDFNLWASTDKDAEYAYYISTARGKIWMGYKDWATEFYLSRQVLAF